MQAGRLLYGSIQEVSKITVCECIAGQVPVQFFTISAGSPFALAREMHSFRRSMFFT